MDDIIAMARKAGIKSGDCYKLTVGHMSIETLERFATVVAAHALVKPCCQDFVTCQQVCMPRAAAAERNKLAAWIIAQGYATGHGETMEGLLEELEREVGFKRAELWIKRISEAVLAEREACAKVCDHMAARCNDIRTAALESAAENIRARSDK